MTEIVYRDAIRSDHPAIVDFQVAMARETESVALDGATCAKGVAAVFDDSALGRYFVAEEDGHVVGSLLITYEWSDWRNGTVWWIQSVYVVPDRRGRGVYAGLYRHVHAIVEADTSLRGIRLYVDRRNTSAQKVYTKLGMNGGDYRGFRWMKRKSEE